MKFEKTPLKDAWLIELEPRGDDRGHFSRTFCKRELEEHGIEFNVTQSNASVSANAGTLRGMHFQKAPASEDKLIRCIRGGLYDVIIDLRADSPTFMQHYGVELTPTNMKMLYVPKGFAHGFMTLVDDSKAFYMVSEYYTPELEGGVRYDDPTFGIEWPLTPTVMTDKDRNWPLYDTLSEPYFT